MELRIEGALVPALAGPDILFKTRAGVAALRYGQLKVVDGAGHRIPAHMQIEQQRLQLVVDDRNAQYPLVIDPYIEQANISAGSSEHVSLSSDGNTALISASQPTVSVEMFRREEFEIELYDRVIYRPGEVFLFTRSGETWSQAQVLKTGADEEKEVYLSSWQRGGPEKEAEKARGEQLSAERQTLAEKENEELRRANPLTSALSYDGGTALIIEGGAVTAYHRSGASYVWQATLPAFGDGLALSADGNTALIGASSDAEGVGAAWVFTRSGEAWSQQGNKLTGTGEVGKGAFGESVALSSDGNTALLGGAADAEGVGAAWVFTRSGEGWSQQGNKLTGTGQIGKANFGDGVALSTDGNTAVVGGSRDAEGAGAAWAFTRSGEAWAQQGEKLTSNGSNTLRLGTSVALSGDGNTALAGGASDTWVFTRTGATWATHPERLQRGNASVALSSDGSTALIGATVWRFVTHLPTPIVTSIAPTEGAAVGGTPVAITGSGFNSITSVKFGPTEATSFSVSSSGSISATAPPGTGTVDVTVTNEEGVSSATVAGDKLTYEPVPSITTVEPNEGSQAGGTSVTVTGTDFRPNTAVKFGATSATSVKVNSPTSLTATAPAGSGVVDITATTAGGISPTSSADRFSYMPRPTVTSVAPNLGPAGGGTAVTVTGTTFTPGTAVTFGSSSATGIIVNSSTSITAISPPGTGIVDVTVTAAGGTSRFNVADRFRYSPTVTEISPNLGAPGGGTTVAITGTNFAEIEAVKFGGNAATSVTLNSPTSITAVAPPGTGAVDVTVVTAGGTSPTSSADHFNYAPTVTGISPSLGAPGGGTTVAITGTNFAEVKAVKFGGSTSTTVTVNSSTSITTVAPPGTGNVDVTVVTAGGTSPTSSADRFDYAPTVTGISPSLGAPGGGTTVTITGTNFAEVQAVKFGANAATGVRVNSPTSITAAAPPGTGAVDVTVATAGGASPTSSADRFNYAPTVASISPEAGPTGGGTSVAITGTNFAEVTAVRFGPSNAASFKVNSPTSITAVSPPGAGGVNVTVTTPGGTSPATAGDQFSFVPPPTVESLNPGRGPATGGTTVTITGTNLNGATAVKFGAVNAASFKVSSPTSITATSPSGSGVVDVSVTTVGGTTATSVNDQFSYLEAPEVGRCVKVAKATGRYLSSTCTSLMAGGSYEWYPGAAKAGFATKIKAATITQTTLETVGKTKVVCKGETSVGHYSGTKEVKNVVISFTGCEAAAQKCHTNGAKEGEVTTQTLEGVLGWQRKTAELKTTKVALDLFPAGHTGLVARFECGTQLWEVRGSVLAPVTADKMALTTTVKYSGTKGKQVPERFEGQPADVLEVSVLGAAFEQAALALTTVQTNEEAVEINAFI
jgi:hypothetical protein